MSSAVAKDARYFLVTLLIIFLALTALLLSGFAAPIIFGLILSGISYPLYTRLLKSLKNKKNIAALIALFVITLIIIVPLIAISTILVTEALDLISTTQNNPDILQYTELETLSTWAAQYNIDISEATRQFVPSIQSVGLFISRQIGSIFSNIANFGLGFFIMLVTIFYILRDGEKIAKLLIDLSPLKTDHELYLYKTFREVSGAIFFGNFVAGIIQGILGGVSFALFGIGSPVFWGVIMGFLALIPVMGPFLVFVPAAIYLYFTGPILPVILFLLFNILITSNVDNLLKPKLIGDKVKIHPLLILLAILGGLKLFGVVGIVYGPLIVAILITLLHIYRDGYHESSA